MVVLLIDDLMWFLLTYKGKSIQMTNLAIAFLYLFM